jgi:hypothetical protein
MTRPTRHDAAPFWLHAIPIVLVATLVIGWWRPVYVSAVPTQGQQEKIDDLARLLGSASSSADAIEERLRSFGPFPPEAMAGRVLADALIACRTGMAELQRLPLARELYAITVQSQVDVMPDAIPRALGFIQDAALASRCDPRALERLVRAARDITRVDPNPRRDWW